MALATYDLAVLDKIKGWFNNTIYSHTAVTYNIIYDLLDEGMNKSHLKFPLINIYRINGVEFSDQQSFAARKRGMNLNRTEQITFEGRFLSGRYISLDLKYQLDFYSKSNENLYALIMQVIHAINQFPIVEVTHHDNNTGEKFTETYEISNISDSTEQSEFDNNDRIYRAYIQFEINNVRDYDITEYTKIKEFEAQLETGGTKLLHNWETDK